MLGGRLILTLLIALGVVAAYATVMAVAMKIGNLIVARDWNVPFSDAWIAMFIVALAGVFLNYVSGFITMATGSLLATRIAFVAAMFCIQVWVTEQRLGFRRRQAAIITAVAFAMLIPLVLMLEQAVATSD